MYGGRGAPAPVEDAGVAQQGHLVGIEGVVRDYVAGVDDPDAFTGEAAAEHYAAITEAARAAFPERELAYLITYGVYGLVQSMVR